MKYRHFSIVAKHDRCWSEFVPSNYIDTLINLEYSSFDIIKATRVGLIKGNKDDLESQLKLALKKDRSILDFEISSLFNRGKYYLYLISMLQEANETIISKFKSKQSIVINANIINGKEVYDIITNNTIADPLKNDMRVNIISLSQDYVSEKNLFKVLSRNTLNILLTGKEQLIMKKAKELGYFDIPRKITSDELAKELNTTKANVSMTLRNIFKKVSTLIAL